jgi:hypothetical protein
MYRHAMNQKNYGDIIENLSFNYSFGYSQNVYSMNLCFKNNSEWQ